MAVQWSTEHLTEMIKLYHTQQFMQIVKLKDTSRMKLQNFNKTTEADEMLIVLPMQITFTTC